jgi:hypothetical protein
MKSLVTSATPQAAMRREMRQHGASTPLPAEPAKLPAGAKSLSSTSDRVTRLANSSVATSFQNLFSKKGKK